MQRTGFIRDGVEFRAELTSKATQLAWVHSEHMGGPGIQGELRRPSERGCRIRGGVPPDFGNVTAALQVDVISWARRGHVAERPPAPTPSLLE